MTKKLKVFFMVASIFVSSFSSIAQTFRDSSFHEINKTTLQKSDTGKRNFNGKQATEPYRIIQTDTIYPYNKKAPIKKQRVFPKKEKNNTDTIKQSREQIKLRKDTLNSNPYKETNPVKGN